MAIRNLQKRWDPDRHENISYQTRSYVIAMPPDLGTYGEPKRNGDFDVNRIGTSEF